MVIKTSYVADDGTPFDTEAECVAYEASKNRQIGEEVKLLNRVCKFFTSTGRQFEIDSTFNEHEIYGVNIHCSTDEVDDVMVAFSNHFDDLYFALKQSDFETNSEVVLAYDWTGNCSGWAEIEYDKKEWLSFVQKVLGWG